MIEKASLLSTGMFNYHCCEKPSCSLVGDILVFMEGLPLLFTVGSVLQVLI
jgi:hypothetical protein